MKYDVTYPMESDFIFSLHKMVAQKSEIFQDEFFRRVHIVNKYLNKAGTTFKDLSIAASITLCMELEEVWGEEEKNE